MNWNDLKQIMKSNPAPPKRVEKTNREWEKLLTTDQYLVTRLHGTERPFSGEYCESYAPGIYTCICCGTALFDSTVQFNSRTGWPSFTGPVTNNVIRYKSDNGFGMERVEVLCNVCDAHLGHVFPDGPAPTGLRFCINSVSLKKEEPGDAEKTNEFLETVTLGGGCFWCVEAILNELEGVTEVESGYAGGDTKDPTYRDVSSGNSGHAEVVQARFDPAIISYADLLRIFMATHNPTSLNRQGGDKGTQYRSVILYHNDEQQKIAREIIGEMQSYFDNPIVTEVTGITKFYKAEQSHQDYYRNNPEKAYCTAVISPKLQKLRTHFGNTLKKKINV